jgi:hypothetical protein
VDWLENLDKMDIERPNSPVNNPAVYANVFLHSGELFQGNVDLQVPGRGFDFAFKRTYRSQSVLFRAIGLGLGPQLQQTAGRNVGRRYFLLRRHRQKGAL